MTTEPDVATLFNELDEAYLNDAESDAEQAAKARGPSLAIAHVVVVALMRTANALERIANAQEDQLCISKGMPTRRPTVAELEEILARSDPEHHQV